MLFFCNFSNIAHLTSFCGFFLNFKANEGVYEVAVSQVREQRLLLFWGQGCLGKIKFVYVCKHSH